MMKIKKIVAQSYLWLVLILLYAPILVIAIFSFTDAKVLGNWTGFSFRLYTSLFDGGVNNSLIRAIGNTAIIGVVAAAVSTLLGTIAAIGIYNTHNKRYKMLLTTMNNVPILNPDIITGISLFLLFVSLGVTQGYITLTLCHITFCTPYVVLSVLPKLRQMNPNTYEAALDMGATPFYALRKVIIPQIKPGMISGFILAFTLSIDDFEVSVFNLGTSGLETLSTYIYSDARKGGLTPELRPLSTIIFIIVLILLLIVNFRSARMNKKSKEFLK